MTEQLVIDFALGDGALVRLLGLIERRGFCVLGLQMDRGQSDAPSRLHLDIQPRDADRRLEVLTAQIERVHGVQGVAPVAKPVEAAA
ncbi:MAG: ACT domain-containing protein [Rhodothalassiaceae bacterium]